MSWPKISHTVQLDHTTRPSGPWIKIIMLFFVFFSWDKDACDVEVEGADVADF